MAHRQPSWWTHHWRLPPTLTNPTGADMRWDANVRHGQSPIHSFMRSLWWWMRDEWGPHSDPPPWSQVHPHPQTYPNIVLKLTRQHFPCPHLYFHSQCLPSPVLPLALSPIPTQPSASLHSCPQASAPPFIHSHPQFHPHIHLNPSLVQP